MDELKSYQDLLSMEPNELEDWLLKNFSKTIPLQLETVEDMQAAGIILGELVNSYSYLMAMSVYAKTAVRNEKRKGKENKENTDDMIDRQNAINTTCDIIKMQYTGLSRLVTIKKEINNELHMSDSFLQ